jgi:hypothetical protein
VAVNRCIEDIRLWAHRCSNPDSSNILNNWCNGFEPP